MLTKKSEIEEVVLIDPVRDHHCNGLKVLSGYATPVMLEYHLDQVKQYCPNLKTEVILGMTPAEGLIEEQHRGFLNIVERHSGCTCSYIKKNQKPCHSKIYVWLKDDEPVEAFIGSANYTQNAFYGEQQESMANCDSRAALEYFLSFNDKIIECRDYNVDTEVNIVSINQYRSAKAAAFEAGTTTIDSINENGKSVRLSLLSSNGEVCERSGLNWGQRPNRDHNQAYLSIPKNIVNSHFFPPRTIRFTLMTDDLKDMICVVAQQGDKAIQTPLDNGTLGRYFRHRLGLAPGSKVTKADLERYGRTDVEIVKVDDETYFMDFSAKKH